MCVCVGPAFWGNRGPLCGHQGGLGAGVSACMQNSCGIIAPSLSCTGGHSSHARRAKGRSSVSMDKEEEEKEKEEGFSEF